MARMKWQDNDIELAEDWRVGELIEAENALSIDMESAKGAAKIALVVYISIRRTNREMPTALLADQVLAMELSALAEEEEEEAEPGPPAEEPAVQEGGQEETDEPPTSGVLRSANTA